MQLFVMYETNEDEVAYLIFQINAKNSSGLT